MEHWSVSNDAEGEGEVLPSTHKAKKPLLRAEPPDEKCGLRRFDRVMGGGICTRRGVKVGLDNQLGRGEPAGYELLAGKISKSDEAVDLFFPSLHFAMKLNHSRYHQALNGRVTIAAVHDGQVRRSSDALFADPSAAQEKGVRADQSIVVECLNDRDTSSTASIINRRGQQGEKVVDVNDVGFEMGEKDAQIPAPESRIVRIVKCGCLVMNRLNLAVMGSDQANMVAMCGEKVPLSRNYGVFATSLSVEIV
jgi:hypothetical protein